jgi:hypothetical protein
MIKAVVNFDLGCYEQIYEPSFPNPTWDFYTFTDLESREHRKCSNEYFFEPLLIEDEEFEGLSSKRKASYFKAQALTLLQKVTGIDYDLVVTIDANVEIVGDLDKFINTHHINHDISMPPHPDCESYLQEVEKIRQINSECGKEIETEDIMEETLDIMTLKGYKFDNGFHESTMSIRTNNKRVKSFEKSWAKNYLEMPTKRDQASLSLTRYEKKSFLFNTLPNPLNHTWQEPFFRKPHKYNEKGSNKL